MKKSIICLMTALMLTTIPAYMSAETKSAKTELALTKEESAARASVLLERLKQIDVLDKSNLTSVEKRSLRKEVTGIKKELKQLDGGIYLSVGAIIIILLILILIF